MQEKHDNKIREIIKQDYSGYYEYSSLTEVITNIAINNITSVTSQFMDTGIYGARCTNKIIGFQNVIIENVLMAALEIWPK